MCDLRVDPLDPKAVGEAVILFDEYRQFYGQSSNLSAAHKFLCERVTAGDSKVFVATLDNIAVGFTQLYPSFSSVAMQRIWILNDLFVTAEHRKKGVATALLQSAQEFATLTHAARLVLATATDNSAAKNLYGNNGWVLDKSFDHYLLKLT